MANNLYQKLPSEESHKKGVLKNFAKSAGNHLCQSLFFNKAADPRPATILKRDSNTAHLWALLL